MIEDPNPMARLWSERRWNKLMLAHGCYWAKCAFCDTSLDYICRYDPATAEAVVDWMESVMHETGGNGFHFVDEAAPPALLRKVSEEIIRRKLDVAWWTNIRFDPGFTAELSQLMAKSGCVAVTGGAECATPRLLKLMRKGVTQEQICNAARNLSGAGILVHAYLMYGFPTQTVEDTVESLEFVRRLFAEGWIRSAYWHRFALTVHSPAYRNPKTFKIRIGKARTPPFAWNEAAFTDPSGVDHAALGACLQRAVYNYRHGLMLDADVREWFDFRN